MNDEVQRVLASTLRRVKHPALRQRLARCIAPGAGVDDLYAASALAMDPAEGPSDVETARALAKAINVALASREQGVHIGTLVERSERLPLPTASRDRPALLAFERASYDGSEPETTVMLPSASSPGEEVSEEAAAAFFKARPDVPLRPEATGRLVELVGDTSAHPRRELRAEVVSACADNIAMLARHRDERPQWERRENEEALLANVDAIGASGCDCVRLVVEWWRAGKDPWKTWAAVFVLACFGRTDVLEAIARELDDLPPDATAHVTTAADALLVAPHPHVAELALDLSVSPNPVARAIGVEVLSRKNLLDPEQVRRHMSDANLPVLAAALRASAVLGPATGSVVLVPFLQHYDHEVVWAATRQLARWHRPEPYFQVRQGRCRVLGRRALELLIQFGDATDLACFDDLVARGPGTVEVLSAVARFGDPSAWVYLVHHLSDPELSDAAARGLMTLFGAVIPRRESKSAAAWRDAIAKCSIEPGLRLRSGKAWHPGAVANECLQGDVDRAETQVRIDELVVRADVTVDVDLALWSPDVWSGLEPALTTIERSAKFRPGSWDCKAVGFRQGRG
jgi:hypothetical protein